MTTNQDTIIKEMERENFPVSNRQAMRKYLTKLEEQADNGNFFARKKLESYFGYDFDKIDGYDDGEGPRGA